MEDTEEKPGRDSAGDDSRKNHLVEQYVKVVDEQWCSSQEHVVSPVTKHFTSFAKMENFIELDIQHSTIPHSFHDFDISTGMLWSFKRFSNMLSQFRIREKSFCLDPIECMLPRERLSSRRLLLLI